MRAWSSGPTGAQITGVAAVAEYENPKSDQTNLHLISPLALAL
jgi:hypothetical protein